MEANRFGEFAQVILTRVQIAYPNVLCRYDVRTGVLVIGRIRISVRLQATIRSSTQQLTGRHSVYIKSEATAQRSVRENSKGWYDFDRIFAFIAEGIVAEEALRRETDRRNILEATSKNLAIQLRARFHLAEARAEGHPPVYVDPCLDVPGTVKVTVEGVPQEVALRLLEMIRTLGLMDLRRDPEQGIWHHLTEDDLPG